MKRIYRLVFVTIFFTYLHAEQIKTDVVDVKVQVKGNNHGNCPGGNQQEEENSTTRTTPRSTSTRPPVTPPPTTRSTRPPTTRSTQPPTTRSTRPPTTRSTRPPTTRSTRPPTTRSTRPPTTQSTQPPTTRPTIIGECGVSSLIDDASEYLGNSLLRSVEGRVNSASEYVAKPEQNSSVSESSVLRTGSLFKSFFLKIVGGNAVEECKFPWMATVTDDLNRQCTGSLIDSRHVITAGHCVGRGLLNPDKMKVGLGSSDRLRMEYFSVSSIHRHPNYTQSFNNDIAIIKLQRSVSIGSCIRPICLSSLPIDVLAGTVCLVSGWGLLNEGDMVGSDILQEVTIPIVSNTACSMVYTGIDDNKICAGYAEGGKDACLGDSGGPLACAMGKQFVAIGIVSYGTGCARPNFPGVYTYLPNYYSWIDQVRHI